MSTSNGSQAADQPRTAYLVKRLESALRSRLDAAVKPYGLTATQYTALAALRTSPGQSSAQLARRSFVSAQTMQEMVVALERRGLVSRAPSPTNRRVLRIDLSARGEAILRDLDDEVDDIEQAMLADLEPQHVETLRHALRACARRLAEQATAPQPPQ